MLYVFSGFLEQNFIPFFRDKRSHIKTEGRAMIKAIAMRATDGRIYTVPGAVRFAEDIPAYLATRYPAAVVGAVFGYVTDQGEFLNARAALIRARENNQIRPERTDTQVLKGDDLWPSEEEETQARESSTTRT